MLYPGNKDLMNIDAGEYKYDNNGSPVIVLRTAEKEFNNNNFQKCIDILEISLQQFPEYAAAYFF
jgi:hypothetical protein